MSSPLYNAMRGPLNAIFFVAARLKIAGRQHVSPPRLPRGEPCILAIAHLSHNDPIPVSVAVPRRIEYMVRKEAFSHAVGSGFMRAMDAFPVDRQGSALPALRESLRRLRGGAVVGIFPEGEVMAGANSALNGGPIKLGAAWLARRANVPIVPCVVLGSRCLSSPISWLPLKRARLWVAFGDPIEPNLEVRASRAGRTALGEAVSAAYLELRHDLEARFGATDEGLRP